MKNASHATSRKSEPTPIFKLVRKVVDAFEDAADDLVSRGTVAEKDARRLLSNLTRPNDERDDRGGRSKDERRARGSEHAASERREDGHEERDEREEHEARDERDHVRRD